MPSGNAVIVPSYDAKANLEAIIAPTVNNDETEGYEPGSLWIDTVAAQAYICVDATTGAANWKTFGGIPAGGLLYKGAWNATTNSPTLGDNGAGGIKGDYYVVSVAGSTSIDGISDWKVLDWIVNNGTIWEKVDNTQAAHDMGGSFHIADTLANLNTKVSDATLVASTHAHMGGADGAILNLLKGKLDDALTGTVSVTISTPDVVGSGTAFDTELQVEDAIKIADEIFTVQAIVDSTHLTLDSNHSAGVSGVTAYRDPDLFSIQTGDGADRLVVTKSGFAAFGDFTTSHSLGALGDVGIGGKLEVDGFAYFDNAAIFASSNIINWLNLYGGGSTADDSLVKGDNTYDQWIFSCGPNQGRQIVITDSINYAKDHDHGTPTHPTVFVHSALDPDIDNGEFLALSYLGLRAGTMETDKVPFDFIIKGAGAKSGAVTNDDGGNLILEGGDKDGSGNDGIVQVGAGFSTSHSLVGKNDFGIGGKFEVAGPAYLDNDVYFANTTHYLGSMIPGSNIKIYASTAVGSIQLRNTIQTPDAPMLLTGALANYWLICEHADEGVDFGFPQQVNPTLCIQSADATTPAQRITVSHIQTAGAITVEVGDLDINCPAQKTIKLSTAVWDDHRVSLVEVQAGGLKPPTWAQFKDDGSSSVGVYAWAFGDEAVGANEEQLFFAAQLPHGFKEGSDILAHIHWEAAVGGAAGEFVKWGLEYTWVNIDGIFGNTTIIASDASGASTATTSEDGTMVADKHYKTKIGTIAGSGKEISSMLICRVFRNSSDTDDDLAQDAFGLEIDFHYQVDTIGSRQELTK